MLQALAETKKQHDGTQVVRREPAFNQLLLTKVAQWVAEAREQCDKAERRASELDKVSRVPRRASGSVDRTSQTLQETLLECEKLERKQGELKQVCPGSKGAEHWLTDYAGACQSAEGARHCKQNGGKHCRGAPCNRSGAKLLKDPCRQDSAKLRTERDTAQASSKQSEAVRDRHASGCISC